MGSRKKPKRKFVRAGVMTIQKSPYAHVRWLLGVGARILWFRTERQIGVFMNPAFVLLWRETGKPVV